LLTQQDALGATVLAVLTQPRHEFGGEHDLQSLAAHYHIPVLYSADMLPDCEFLISVQYHRILTSAQLGKARRAAVNLHMAPLPEYRGSNQFTHAILDGKEEFGTTLHVMDARIDHGPILAQRRWPVPPGQWVESLYAQTVEESVVLFEESLPGLLKGTLALTPQQDLIPRYGTALHLRKGMETLKRLDLSWPAEKLERHLRATYMPGFEPPYAMVDGRKVHLIPEALTA
jgi:methionyl-tRNA formyltransferase